MVNLNRHFKCPKVKENTHRDSIFAFQEYCISELHKLNNKEDMVALESNEDAWCLVAKKKTKKEI